VSRRVLRGAARFSEAPVRGFCATSDLVQGSSPRCAQSERCMFHLCSVPLKRSSTAEIKFYWVSFIGCTTLIFRTGFASSIAVSRAIDLFRRLLSDLDLSPQNCDGSCG
jgi:hypothetical protein